MTTGAKTGQPREVQLAYFHDGSDPILIASNYGGTKTPAVVLQPEGTPSNVNSATSDLWRQRLLIPTSTRACSRSPSKIYAGYGDYRATTASVGRQIPIFRLKPR